MKNLISFLKLVALGLVVYSLFNFFILNKNVKYETTSQFGIGFDIPDNYNMKYYDTQNMYVYATDSQMHQVAVALVGPIDMSLQDYLSVLKDLFGNKDYVDAYSKSVNEKISNMVVKESSTEYINGIEMGKVVVNCDFNDRGKNHILTMGVYCFLHNNNIIQFEFASKNSDKEKYREIMDHVVNSIRLP